MDHYVCIGTNVVDLGAITPFFVLFRVREEIYELLEACCGARLTVSYVRIGGLANDVPADFADRCRTLVARSDHRGQVRERHACIVGALASLREQLMHGSAEALRQMRSSRAPKVCRGRHTQQQGQQAARRGAPGRSPAS